RGWARIRSNPYQRALNTSFRSIFYLTYPPLCKPVISIRQYAVSRNPDVKIQIPNLAFDPPGADGIWHFSFA
ncbi:MAG: hypothetical protein AAB260_01150, partial [Planctomycetota bacterium]